MNSRIEMPEWVIVSAVRYAMHRMTYIVGETCELVTRLWPKLSDEAKTIIARDVDDELRRGQVGMAMDDRKWRELTKLWREKSDGNV